MLISWIDSCRVNLVQECIKHKILPNFVWIVRLFIWVYYRGGPRWRHWLLWILPDVSFLHLGGPILSIFTLHSNQGWYILITKFSCILLFTHSYIISIKKHFEGYLLIFCFVWQKKKTLLTFNIDVYMVYMQWSWYW